MTVGICAYYMNASCTSQLVLLFIYGKASKHGKAPLSGSIWIDPLVLFALMLLKPVCKIAKTSQHSQRQGCMQSNKANSKFNPADTTPDDHVISK